MPAAFYRRDFAARVVRDGGERSLEAFRTAVRYRDNRSAHGAHLRCM
jgi:hypothetical protein